VHDDGADADGREEDEVDRGSSMKLPPYLMTKVLPRNFWM
jgi:hypothetical protein